MPALDSSESEYLQYLAVLQACWWHLPLALQRVSGCHALLHSKLVDKTCSWLSSLWVAFVPHWVPSLLMMPALISSESKWLPCLCISILLTMAISGSSVCEWLLCLTAFQVCWLWLSGTFRMWVADCLAVLFLLMTSLLGSSLTILIHCLPACMYIISFQAC